MPDQLMPEPESSKSAASSRVSLPDDVTLTGASSGSESDLAGLAALFATHGGNSLPAQVSADLALEIVLNEIVEQACHATDASGAAIALLRDGEMVCRARSGTNAPELGARLGSESGLTAECVKTRQVQRCDDAQADPRADIEASRSLGVRSVMIHPLLSHGALLGVLEVFSSSPEAFGEADELTLEALAHRILKNLEQARASFRTATQNPVPAPVLPIPPTDGKDLPAGSTPSPNEVDLETPEHLWRRSRPRLDVANFALGAAVVVCAVLLGTLLGVGLGWRRSMNARGALTKSTSSAARKEAALNSAAQIVGEKTGAGAAGGASLGTNVISASSGTGNSMAPASEKKDGSAHPITVSRANVSPAPAGSLLVYEGGKEIFRMPPAVQDNAKSSKGTQGTAARGKMQPASALEPADIVQLSPEGAEGSLLHRVEPEYPEEARQQRIQGPVVLDVRIGRDGAVQEVNLVSGHRLLADAAIAAVRQWRFKPRVLVGHPVEMQTRVTLNFRMPT